MARKAIADGLVAKCSFCEDPIVPGDFVASGSDEHGFAILVHAGFHFTLEKRDAFCETGAVSNGVWNGKWVESLGESLAARALRTGEPQVL